MGWRERAACRRVEDPEIFFPDHGNTRQDATTTLAKQYCRVCSVRDECLSEAEPFGIWGGFTAPERAALQREGLLTP